MKYLLILLVLLFTEQYECRFKIRNSDRRQDDSLNINVSAGYGVQNNNENNQVTNSVEPDGKTEEGRVSTVYALSAEQNSNIADISQNPKENNSSNNAVSDSQVNAVYTIQENPEQHSNTGYTIQEEDHHENQLGPIYITESTGPHDVPTAQFLVSNDHEQSEFSPIESLRQTQHNYHEQTTENPISYQVYEPIENVEAQQYQYRPNVLELQNPVPQKKQKIFQVLKVPAVYEIHLQSDMPHLGQQYINIKTDDKNPVNLLAAPNHYSDSPKYYSKPQYVVKYANEGLPAENEPPILPPIIRHHFGKSQYVDQQYNNLNFGKYHHQDLHYKSPKAYSHVSIKHHRFPHQPIYHQKKIPSFVQIPRPPKTTTPLPIVHSTSTDDEILLNLQQPQTSDFDFNYFEDYKKPQALHEVPAPILTDSSKEIFNQQLHSESTHSHEGPTITYISHENHKEVVNPPQAFTYEQIPNKPNYHFVKPTINHHENLIYGKQIETVNAPANYYEKIPTPLRLQNIKPSWKQRGQRYFGKNIQSNKNVNEILTAESSHPGTTRNKVHTSNENGLSLFYASETTTEKPVEEVTTESNAENNNKKPIMYGEKLTNYPKWKNHNEYNAYMNKKNPRPFRKFHPKRRNDRNDNSMVNYVIYITEKSLD